MQREREGEDREREEGGGGGEEGEREGEEKRRNNKKKERCRETKLLRHKLRGIHESKREERKKE